MGNQDITRHLVVLIGTLNNSAQIDLRALPILKQNLPLNAILSDNMWELSALSHYCKQKGIDFIQGSAPDRTDSALDILNYVNDHPLADRIAYVCKPEHDPAPEILTKRGFDFQHITLA